MSARPTELMAAMQHGLFQSTREAAEITPRRPDPMDDLEYLDDECQEQSQYSDKLLYIIHTLANKLLMILHVNWFQSQDVTRSFTTRLL